MSWFSRLANVFRSRRLNLDLEDEIRFHLDSRAAEFRRRGMTWADAARAAQRRLGNESLVRETSRDVKLLPGSIPCARHDTDSACYVRVP